MLFGFERFAGEDFPDFEIGQCLFLVGEFGVGVVGTFDIRSQVAGEVDGLAADLEDAAFAFDGDDDSSSARIGHLAGDGTLPDQVKQAEFVVIEGGFHRFRQAEGMPCGADRFVSFLGVFHLGLVGARLGRQIVGTVVGINQLACVFHSDFGQVGRVGTHVGDVTVFVQALGDLHCPASGETKLTVTFLLQRAGGKRRIWFGRVRLFFDFRDREFASLNAGGQIARGLLVEVHQLIWVLQLAVGRIKVFAAGNFLAFDRHQRRFKLLAARLGEHANQIPPAAGDKRHAFALTLNDQAYGNTLHPAGGEAWTDFAPQ